VIALLPSLSTPAPAPAFALVRKEEENNNNKVKILVKKKRRRKKKRRKKKKRCFISLLYITL
jgi:hypothetical protein